MVSVVSEHLGQYIISFNSLWEGDVDVEVSCWWSIYFREQCISKLCAVSAISFNGMEI